MIINIKSCLFCLVQLRKEIEDLTVRLGQQAAAQDSKENIKEEREIKEEDSSSNPGCGQIKDEAQNTSTIKKEGEEDQEVLLISINYLQLHP